MLTIAYFEEKSRLHFNEDVRFMTHEQAERAMCALIRSHLKRSLVTKPTECSVVVAVKTTYNLGGQVNSVARETSERILSARTSKACYKQSVIDNIGRAKSLNWDESADPFHRRGCSGGKFKSEKPVKPGCTRKNIKDDDIRASECGMVDGKQARARRDDIKVVNGVEYELIMGRWVRC